MDRIRMILHKGLMLFLDSDLCIHSKLRNWRHQKKSRIYEQEGKHILWGKRIDINYPKNIKIGNHTLINDDFVIYGNGGVTVGNYVYTAPSVKIITVTHNLENMEELKKSVEINDLCWIGTGVIILPGVSIGKGCVIGAGSVVSRSIPEYTVAAGNPCRVFKERTIIFPYRLPSGFFYLDDKYRIITLEKSARISHCSGFNYV